MLNEASTVASHITVYGRKYEHCRARYWSPVEIQKKYIVLQSAVTVKLSHNF